MPICKRCEVAFLESEQHVCSPTGHALSTTIVLSFLGRMLAAICVPFLSVIAGFAVAYELWPSSTGIVDRVGFFGGPILGFLLLPHQIRRRGFFAALVYFPLAFMLLTYFAINYAGNVYHFADY